MPFVRRGSGYIRRRCLSCPCCHPPPPPVSTALCTPWPLSLHPPHTPPLHLFTPWWQVAPLPRDCLPRFGAETKRMQVAALIPSRFTYLSNRGASRSGASAPAVVDPQRISGTVTETVLKFDQRNAGDVKIRKGPRGVRKFPLWNASGRPREER